jgi:hypothetical protein
VSSGSGLDRVEGGVRATPLPRSNRARCAKERIAKELVLGCRNRRPSKAGLPTAATLAIAFQKLLKGKDLTAQGQSLESGILVTFSSREK